MLWCINAIRHACSYVYLVLRVFCEFGPTPTTENPKSLDMIWDESTAHPCTGLAIIQFIILFVCLFSRKINMSVTVNKRGKGIWILQV